MTPRKTKIVHFIDSGGLYGAESVLLNLSGLMVANGRYEPVVGCIVSHPNEQNDLYDRAREQGLAAEKFVIRNTLLLVDLPRAADRMRKTGVRLIHSHGYKPSVFGYAISLLTGISVMATCHLWYKGDHRPLKTRIMMALELFVYRFFKVIVAVSEPIKETLLGARLLEAHIRVIENGVEVRAVRKASPRVLADLRRELHLVDGEYCVLNTGRLTKQKAQQDIVAAAALVRDRGLAVRFLIVGEGELWEELHHQVTAAGVGDMVDLLGFRNDIPALLQIADLFVLPSLDEGMPMSLLEAAAVGLPVLTTAVGDIPKLIEDQVTGLIVPVGDPQALADRITSLQADPGLASRLGATVRERICNTYSNEVMFARYDQVYFDLLN